MTAYPKRMLALLLVLSSSVFCLGQSNLDSLKRLLSIYPDDTNRVMTLYRVGRAYSYYSTDTSMIYADSAHELAIKLKFQKGEWMSLNLKANNLNEIGDYPNALANHLKVLKVLEQLKDPVLIAISEFNIGR